MEQFEDRLKKIEERLTAIENGFDSKSFSPQSPLILSSEVKKSPSHINLWLKENWLTSIGIFLVLLAGGWFIGYAFSNNWIGEIARILLCLAFGTIIYAWGIITLNKASRVGVTLILLGEAILMMSLFAGYQLYAILPMSSAFALMVIITAITTVIALIRDLEGLGFASIIATTIIPLLIHEDNYSHTFLINYVLLIDIAALFMLIMHRWGWTFHLAWFATMAYSSSLYFVYNKSIVYFCIALFYLLFFLPAAFSACGRIDKKLPLKGAAILISSTIALIIWVASLVPFKWDVICYSISALFSFYFSYIMAKNWDSIHNKSSDLRYTLGTIFGFNIMVFIFMSINSINGKYEFDIQTISYLIQTIIAMGVAQYVLLSSAAAIGLAIYFLVPLNLLLSKYPDILCVSFYTLDFMALCIATVSFPIAFWIVYKTQVPAKLSSFQKFVSRSLGFFTVIFLMSLIWNICQNVITNVSIARSSALVIYILAAEALIYIGNLKQLKNLRLGGVAIIIFVILCLFLNEIWIMPVVIRTITFVVTGFLLIGTAWFDKKIVSVK